MARWSKQLIGTIMKILSFEWTQLAPGSAVTVWDSVKTWIAEEDCDLVGYYMHCAIPLHYSMEVHYAFSRRPKLSEAGDGSDWLGSGVFYRVMPVAGTGVGYGASNMDKEVFFPSDARPRILEDEMIHFHFSTDVQDAEDRLCGARVILYIAEKG